MDFEHACRQSEYLWEKIITKSPLGRLQLAEALWARYDIERDQSSTALAEKRDWLRGCIGALLREADPALVLQNFHVRRLVLQIFGDAGLKRLELRANERRAA